MAVSHAVESPMSALEMSKANLGGFGINFMGRRSNTYGEKSFSISPKKMIANKIKRKQDLLEMKRENKELQK
jgi:hypothetical protein